MGLLMATLRQKQKICELLQPSRTGRERNVRTWCFTFETCLLHQTHLLRTASYNSSAQCLQECLPSQARCRKILRKKKKKKIIQSMNIYLLVDFQVTGLELVFTLNSMQQCECWDEILQTSVLIPLCISHAASAQSASPCSSPFPITQPSWQFAAGRALAEMFIRAWGTNRNDSHRDNRSNSGRVTGLQVWLTIT